MSLALLRMGTQLRTSLVRTALDSTAAQTAVDTEPVVQDFAAKVLTFPTAYQPPAPSAPTTTQPAPAPAPAPLAPADIPPSITGGTFDAPVMTATGYKRPTTTTYTPEPVRTVSALPIATTTTTQPATQPAGGTTTSTAPSGSAVPSTGPAPSADSGTAGATRPISNAPLLDPVPTSTPAPTGSVMLDRVALSDSTGQLEMAPREATPRNITGTLLVLGAVVFLYLLARRD